MALLKDERFTAVDAADKDGKTALHVAASGDDLECLKMLLAEGADLNRADRSGTTLKKTLPTFQQQLSFGGEETHHLPQGASAGRSGPGSVPRQPNMRRKAPSIEKNCKR